MKRREFLVFSGSLLLAGRVQAVPGENRFLLVFLRGGYDAANVLVPVSSAFYEEARPSIRIRREETLGIDAEWGLHPALRSVHELFKGGEAAFVPFAGTEDLTRSHFETQDSIELGQPLGRSRNYQSGFLNRLVATLDAGSAVSFTDQLPIVFRGDARVANAGLRFPMRASLDARQQDLIGSMYGGTPLAASVAEGFASRDAMMKDMGTEMAAASRNAVNARGFEQGARRVAKLMKGSYNVGFIDVGGWDTHVGEGGAQGYLAQRLEELGRGLAAFREEMGPAWRQTVVAVISEFGRTFRENGNRGTDHGHGTVLWLLGGAVRGGRIAGEQVAVSRETLFQDRDFPVLNDYRSVLGGIYGRLYGLDAAKLDKVFPGAKPADLGLL